MLNTIDEALNWLYSLKDNTKRKDLSKITNALIELKIKTNYQIVHITGTNGKGSTANYLKQILKNTGRHIGVFTSPYVLFFNDRIMINDRYISNSEIMFYLNKLQSFFFEYSKLNNVSFSFFEATFLLALLYFEASNIDIAIIECGIGGKLDITNCLATDYQIITSIGYDHMSVLGNTLEEILDNKLGIAKTTCYLALDHSFDKQLEKYSSDNNVKIINIIDYITDICLDTSVSFCLYKEKYSLNTIALYQAINASLAICVAKEIEPRLNTDMLEYGLNDSLLPGRMEIINKEPLIIFDGAHNISATKALVDSISKIKKNKKLITVYSSLKDKDYQGSIMLLDSVTDEYYFTVFPDNRVQLPHNYKTNIKNRIIDLNEIIYNENNIYLFTGSLHFISYLIEKLKKI